MSAPESTDSVPAGPAVWTVSQLAARIEGSLRDGLPAKIRIAGEISGPRQRTHWYFDLKDAGAVVSCVWFASAQRRSSVVPQDGQQVVVSGHVDFYAKAGKVSVIVDRVELVGEGAMDQAFRALCDELRMLGWFDPARKRPLPVFPRRIGVITSRSGAALQDVLDTMRRRCPAVGVVLVDVRVQGDGAAEEIAGAIRRLGRSAGNLGLDALLVTRGGGSKEDLWAFNERLVAAAIVESPIPVVAAIGHETDTTIAELVADERGATPTQAAMRLTPDRAALASHLDALSRRARHAMHKRIEIHRHRLSSVGRHPAMADPRRALASAMQTIEVLGLRLRGAVREDLRVAADLTSRLSRRLDPHRPAAVHARRAARLEFLLTQLRHAMLGRLADADLEGFAAELSRAVRGLTASSRTRIEACHRQIEAVSPLAVLQRGYSVTLGCDGKPLRSVAQVEPGDVLSTRMIDGAVHSQVTGREEGRFEARGSPVGPTPRRASQRSKPDDGPQMDLFRSGR